MRLAPQPRGDAGTPGRTARRRRFGLAVGAVVAVLFAAGAAWFATGGRFSALLVDLGRNGETPLARELVRGTGDWIDAVRHDVEVPRLVLDIKFKHVKTLRAKRDEALEAGVLIAGDADFVPAVLGIDGHAVRVKVRLKGDWADHFRGDKWSLRVHVRDDEAVLGLRRFSLQHPRSRQYHHEALFLDALRREGLLAPRYRFVELSVNGTEAGLMALEEHFSKELLESQGRRDSAILKFDESWLWAATDGTRRGFDGLFDDYRNAPVGLFGEGRVRRDAALTAEAEVAIGLLRAFQRGALPPAAVFDVRTTGGFLALTEIWGAWHAVRWHNLRFYYNPLLARLEPIGFDANVGEINPPAQRIAVREPLIRALLADPAIAAAYRETLLRVAQALAAPGGVADLRAREAPLLVLLRREFPLLRPFDVEGLRDRAAALAAEIETGDPAARGLPSLVHAHVLAGPAGAPVLEVSSAVPFPVELRAIVIDGPTGSRRVALPDGPLRLTPREAAQPGPLRTVALPELAETETVRVEAAAPGAASSVTTVARFSAPPRDVPPLAPRDARLESFPFLTIDPTGYAIRPGTWDVERAIVLPEGRTLTLSAGTTLRFAADAALVVRGPLHVRGTAEAPVELTGRGDAAWPGLVVLRAGARSELQHLHVVRTSGVRLERWSLTGGVVFYESEVSLDTVRLTGNRGEDALNVIRSRFALRDVTIEDTQSDGFDADFSDGTVTGGAFERIGLAGGGDAIDVSGSRVEIRDVYFEQVRDKALSVGEASTVRARGLTMRAVGTGAAAKDGSTLRLSGSTIDGARIAGLMTYIKKAEYGSPRLEAVRVEVTRSPVPALAQSGSVLWRDGLRVAESDVDVEQLYRTAMRPGLRR